MALCLRTASRRAGLLPFKLIAMVCTKLSWVSEINLNTLIDGHILCLDFVCSMLKIGGEAIVVTDALYAYGDEGLPGKVKPNEGVLIFVRVVSASKGHSLSAEVQLIILTSVVSR